MVFISAKTKKYYPNFSRLVETKLPSVPNNKKYWKAVKKALQFTDGKNGSIFKAGKAGHSISILLARTHFNLGSFPKVKLAIIGSSTSYKDAGAFNPLRPNEILVNALWVKKFENDPSTNQAINFMFATVVHELIHFLDFTLDGKAQDYQLVKGKMVNKKPKLDPGFVFEKHAFGGDVPPW